MRLAHRLAGFVALVAVAPLATVTLVVVNVTQQAVTDAILRAEVSTAQGVADAVARQLADTEQGVLLQLANFRLDTASDEAREAFVVATWRATPSLSVASLLDTDGALLVAPMHAGRLAPEGAEGRPAALDGFRRSLPAPGPAGTVTYGAVARVADAMTLPFVASSPRADGIAFAGAVALDAVAERLAGFSTGARAVALYDVEGRLLARGGDPGLIDATRIQGLLSAARVDYRYTTGDGVDVLAASARVPAHGALGAEWTVVVAEPAAQVATSAEEVRARAAYIGSAAAIFAALAGTFFAAGIAGPVTRLRDAAIAFGRGEFGARVVPDGGAEVEDLGRAFNGMSESLEARTRELAESNAKIQRFNLELQASVEARTAELRAAQDDLVEAGRLAAVAELGAGLAHELNNPLAGTLGALQLARTEVSADSRAARLLAMAEVEAERCRGLVATLVRLGEATPDGKPEQVDIAEILMDSVELATPLFRRAGVTPSLQAEPVMARLSRGLLAQTLAHLLGAVRGVAAPGHLQLRLTRDSNGGRAVLHLSCEARPDADAWAATGLSGWLARDGAGRLGGELQTPERGASSPVWTLTVPGEAVP